jgi:Skp family chaperone for outer membrane proteins
VTTHRTTPFLAAFAAALVLASAAAPPARAEVKIGVFDFQRVSEETARGQALRADLEKFGEKKKAELAAKEAELKQLEDTYKEQAFSLATEKRQQLEKDIQKKQLELQSVRDAANKEMQIEVNEAQGRFNEELVRVIQALGRERGYSIVFAREQVAYAADAIDMTGEVIERFNQETAKPAAAVAPAAAPKPAAPAPQKP